jgi:hypothetical protein
MASLSRESAPQGGPPPLPPHSWVRATRGPMTGSGVTRLIGAGERRITPELEAARKRLDQNPLAMRQRRETVEHPFGVLASNLTRVFNIVSIQPLMAAICG